MNIYSVTQLTQTIKFLLENSETLQNTWVSGEISNFTKHSSGHVYFTLKDDGAAIACVMFRNVAMSVATLPKPGDKLEVMGSVTVYPPRGNYQVIVQAIRLRGQGDLYQKFLELKSRLEQEGLFDPLKKKPLPAFPRTIGVVTSPTGAVIRDIIKTVRRRYPHVKIVLSPATVQGDQAAASIIRALELLNEKPGMDTIILARGGGSMEDLWCFNDESLARTIAVCPVPVISGIGHETDFTIADFVADRRASTPTAAAELAVPDSKEIRKSLQQSGIQIRKSLQNFIDFRKQLIDDFQFRLEQAVMNPLEYARGELAVLSARLDAFDVRKTLQRGYTITLAGKKALRSVKQVKRGDLVMTMAADGQFESEIRSVKADA